jgi:cytochrome bd-type quinol oxidase subunit 1
MVIKIPTYAIVTIVIIVNYSIAYYSYKKNCDDYTKSLHSAFYFGAATIINLIFLGIV